MSNYVTVTSHKQRRTALILCIIGGCLGLHYFYVGRYGKGILFIFTAGLCGIGWISDISKILKGRFVDQYGNPLIEW